MPLGTALPCRGSGQRMASVSGKARRRRWNTMRRMKLTIAFRHRRRFSPLLACRRRRRRRQDSLGRSQGHGQVHRAGHRRAAGADLRARARRRRHEESGAPIASCCSCTAPARRPKSPSTCRPATTAGWPTSPTPASTCSRWTPRLRPIDPAGADERSVQPVRGAAEQFVPALIPAPCKADLSRATHDDRLRLERHRCRRRSHPQAAQRAEGEPGRVVARRTARRRLCGAASGQGESPGAARARLRPRRALRTRRRCRGRAPCFNTQSRSEFDANWDRQIGCENQFDPKVREVVWAEMIASDPAGAKWGTGVRRAPSTTTWGWNKAMVGGMKTPTLMIAGGARQAGAARSRARRVRRPRLERQGADRSRLLVAQRDVGEQSPDDVQRLARVAEGRRRRRPRNGVLKLGYPKS